jgi:hypothetical protein
VAHEIIKGRLYYVALTRKPQDTAKSLYFTTDNTLVYWNFFLDFGPLNLGQTYRFCELLNRLLAAPEHKDKVIYYYSSTHSHRRTNSVMLMTAWALIYLGRSPEEAFAPFEDVYPAFPPFHDASPCVCTYKLTIRKCHDHKVVCWWCCLSLFLVLLVLVVTPPPPPPSAPLCPAPPHPPHTPLDTTLLWMLGRVGWF